MKRGIAVLILSCLLACNANAAGKRVALVIGISAYKHTEILPNPTNDLADIASVLTQLGFKVLHGQDLSKADFERLIREFSTELDGAELGLFFYAGHGLQVAGQNYLVPVDAQLSSASALDFEMVRLDLVHRTMERSALTNIIFLDACRNNPLERNLRRSMGTRSAEIGKGLAVVELGVGTLISFSTQPGNVALDGVGRNSPFTSALVRHLANSSDDLSAILIAVRNDVMWATQKAQVPWEHSALTGRLYFRTNSDPKQASPVGEAERAWEQVKNSEDQALLAAFVKQFGESFYGAIARSRLDTLKQRGISTQQAGLDGRWVLKGTSNGNCIRSKSTLFVDIDRGVAVITLEGKKYTGTVKDGVLRMPLKDGAGRPFPVVVKLTGNSGSGHFTVEGTACAGQMEASRIQ